MSTFTDARETSTFEAAKVAQDVTRRFMDESSAFSRTYFNAWAATAQAGLRTSFDLQNAMIQATWTVWDAACQASRNWFDQTTDSVRKSQDATSKMVAGGIEMAESIVPRPRA